MRRLNAACWRDAGGVQVSAFVTVLDKDLSDRVRTSEIDIEPLLTSSYSSLFAQEAERRLKSVALAFYAQPPSGVLGGVGAQMAGGGGGGLAAGGGAAGFAGWAV
jgi:hypothetical protein